MFRPHFRKGSNLFVTEHLDAAALADSMDRASDPFGFVESELKGFRRFRAWDFNTVLSSVFESFVGYGIGVGIG
jgi:hypothetical protein